MSYTKLKDRIESYYNSTDYHLLNRVPLVISVNGRNFSKVTSLIDKPYCEKFTDSMLSTAIKLCSEIEGTVFAYHYNDEIVIIARNDQHTETMPWHNNRIQKICSVVSSIATLHFNNVSSSLNLLGDALFTTQIFVVPNVAEAINTFVYKQQQNFHIAVHSACIYELLKTHDKNFIKDTLTGLSLDEKIDLLHQECGINFNKYPIIFRRGAAVYKVPKLSGDVMKNKWVINGELPIFTKDQSFLSNIFRNGSDIFRDSSL